MDISNMNELIAVVLCVFAFNRRPAFYFLFSWGSVVVTYAVLWERWPSAAEDADPACSEKPASNTSRRLRIAVRPDPSGHEEA